MSTESHLDRLRKKHQSLSTQVERAQRALGSSDGEIAQLKKAKLQIKEEITRMGGA